MLEHFRLVAERFGEQQGTVLMRKYACCYANGRPGARAFRANVAKATTAAEFYAIVERYFPRDDMASLAVDDASPSYAAVLHNDRQTASDA